MTDRVISMEEFLQSKQNIEEGVEEGLDRTDVVLDYHELVWAGDTLHDLAETGGITGRHIFELYRIVSELAMSILDDPEEETTE